jgi:ribulose-phosphate 3-epimerase
MLKRKGLYKHCNSLLTFDRSIRKYKDVSNEKENFMAKKNILIAPSILSADFGHLAEESKKLEEAGANMIHIDIMDGHFVPNLTLGPKAVAAINKATKLFLDVHIMVYQPFEYVERLVESGADRITFHFEATEDVEDTLNFIRKCNCEAGLAFRPETSREFIPKYLDKCDLILLMTVSPGFGGQKFMHDVLEKVKFTRDWIDSKNIRKHGKVGSNSMPPFDIQVDGGVNLETAELSVEAGANVLVAGTYLFQQPDMSLAIKHLKEVK